MNNSISKLLSGAIVAGLLTSAVALAQDESTTTTTENTKQEKAKCSGKEGCNGKHEKAKCNAKKVKKTTKTEETKTEETKTAPASDNDD